MFKTKTKILIILLCLSTLILCGSFVFALNNQNIEGDVSINYTADQEKKFNDLLTKAKDAGTTLNLGFLNYKITKLDISYRIIYLTVTGYNKARLNGVHDLFIEDYYDTEDVALFFYDYGIDYDIRIKYKMVIESISESAFAGATEFTSLTIDGRSKMKIGAHAFDGCTNLTDVDFTGMAYEFGDFAFAHTGITSVEILELAGIGKGVFSYCPNLGSIVIYIDNGVFTSRVYGNECNMIVSSHYSEENPVKIYQGCKSSIWASDYTFVMNELLNKGIGVYVEDYAFAGNSPLSSFVVLPNSYIGKYAFASNEFKNRFSIHCIFGPCVIDEYAFANCTMPSIGFGDFGGVGGDASFDLKPYSFQNCVGLTSVVYLQGVTFTKYDTTFDGCGNIEFIEQSRGGGGGGPARPE